MLNAADVARRLGISARKVYDAALSNFFPVCVRARPHWRRSWIDPTASWPAALTDAEIAAICAKRNLDVTCHTCYNGTAIAIDGDLPESNMQTTFTVLVTLEHDEGQGHSPSRISEIVQCALEEGTSCSGGFASAQVDAFNGLAITDTRIGTRSEMDRLHRILPLHRRAVA